MKRTTLQHGAPANDAISYAGYRFPPDVISYAVWLWRIQPVVATPTISASLLAGVIKSRVLSGLPFRRAATLFSSAWATGRLARGDKWRLDEVVVTINGKKHWLWRAVDQHGAVLDVLVQSRRDRHAAKH
jgi:putative transposase